MTDYAPISVSLTARTDVGVVRTNNEDNYLILALATGSEFEADALRPPSGEMCAFDVGSTGAVLAVSDGMGGALAGEVASQMAVRGVAHLMRRYQEHEATRALPIHARLRLAIEATNASIHRQSQGRPEYAGMGATFTAVAIEPNTIHLAQVGDSRAYLIRGSRIRQVTKDQSLVEHLLESGYLTEEQAARHAYRNVILQALGAHPETDVVIDRIDACRDDQIILCSDGLSNKVSAEEMLEITQQSPSLTASARNLIELAKERGGEDNITVIVAQIVGNDLPRASSVELQTQRVERMPLSIEALPMIEEELDSFADDETIQPASGSPASAAEGDVSGGAGAEMVLDSGIDAHLPFPIEPGMTQEDVRVSAILLTILAVVIVAALLAGWWYLRVRVSPSPANEIPSSDVVRGFGRSGFCLLAT